MPLNQREKERKGWGWRNEYIRTKRKNKLEEEHVQRTKEDHKKGEKIWLYKQKQHHNSTKFN